MMPSTPAGVYLSWNLSAEDIKKRVGELIKKEQAVYDFVGSLKEDDVNIDNILLKLAHNDFESSVERNILDFPQHVAVDKEIRTASTEADKVLSEFDVEMSMRHDVFNNLVALQDKQLDIKGEQKRYLEKLIKNGKRNGLHLDASVQENIKEVKKQMSELSIEFNKNCNEENTILEFTEEELSGLPEDFLSSLDKTDDGSKYQVTLKYPHYFPCIKNARNPETRKKLDIAFNRRCISENTPILEELVRLRDQKVKILGYPTHAAFVTEILMSKTAENVKTFLSDLTVKMNPLGTQDINLMLKLKKEECAKYGFQFDNEIHYWDLRYYMNMVEKLEYSVDHEKLKEYFPMNVVTSGLLEIYQGLLCVKFDKVDNAEVWHDDVTMYSVRDAESGKLMGYFYLDLFPRKGKFGHAACFGLQPGCLKKDGSRSLCVAAMVANFTKPTDNKPSLLTHDEVETFFHEFGHVMHQLCSETELVYFSGTKVERDFVEAPSQMLENWCWDKDALKRMSKHYIDGSDLPSEMIETLIKSRNANSGVFNLRQILLGTFDQRIHTGPEANTAEVFAQTSLEVLKIAQTEGTNMSATFGHLAGGYDARYYGYLWSEVYSMDMFYSRFKEEGIFNAQVGQSYRENILKPGGSLDAMDLLKNFLGREPNEEAFLVSKGLALS